MSEVGICEDHNRSLEALCKTCEILICPSCVLFGHHQKHDVLNLEEGEKFLRESIEIESRKGTLKKEITDKSLLEIREYRSRLDRFKTETLKNVDEIFKNIIQVMKERKNNIISEILEKNSEERDRIGREENNWLDKQEITEGILSLMNDKDKTGVLVNSNFIMNGLRKLEEATEFKRLAIHNDLDMSLKINIDNNKEEEPIVISFDEILQYFSRYISFNEPNVLEYRS